MPISWQRISGTLSGAWSAAYKYVARDPYDPWLAYRPADPAFRDLLSLGPGDGIWIKMTVVASWTLPGE